MKWISVLLSLQVLLAGGPLAEGVLPEASPPGPTPRIKGIQTKLVGALTGPMAPVDQKPWDICGTDLGIMTELNHRIFFFFGDTFGYDGGTCRGFGGPNWRSNVMAIAREVSPEHGVALERWLTNLEGKAVAVAEGAHQPAFTGTTGEQTKIPTAAVAVGTRLYLHLMSVHGFAKVPGEWECNGSNWAFSDDFGTTWTQADGFFGGKDSKFNMLALTAQRGTGNEAGDFVYALGTPCGRYGAACCARVATGRLLEPSAWEYFAGYRGQSLTPRWSAHPADAVEVVPAPVGEGSILWNPYLQRWMFTTLNERTHALELRESVTPWGPWGVPERLATSAQFPQLYGAYMTPSFLRDAGHRLYFVMSMYGPYNAYLMRADLDYD